MQLRDQVLSHLFGFALIMFARLHCSLVVFRIAISTLRHLCVFAIVCCHSACDTGDGSHVAFVMQVGMVDSRVRLFCFVRVFVDLLVWLARFWFIGVLSVARFG